MYINDLVENVDSDVKMFADDTSLFSVVCDEATTAQQLNGFGKGTFMGMAMENGIQCHQN